MHTCTITYLPPPSLSPPSLPPCHGTGCPVHQHSLLPPPPPLPLSLPPPPLPPSQALQLSGRPVNALTLDEVHERENIHTHPISQSDLDQSAYNRFVADLQSSGAIQEEQSIPQVLCVCVYVRMHTRTCVSEQASWVVNWSAAYMYTCTCIYCSQRFQLHVHVYTPRISLISNSLPISLFPPPSFPPSLLPFCPPSPLFHSHTYLRSCPAHLSP